MFELRLHPMLVHFPIALLFTSVLFDAAGAWFKHENFVREPYGFLSSVFSEE